MKAIYQVIENGQTNYFRSVIAGGYSYPFFIFEYVRRMAWQLNSVELLGKFNYTELFPLLKANKDFPEVYLESACSSRSRRSPLRTTSREW